LDLHEGSIMGLTTVAALTTAAVLNTIGVNTHLDSFNYGYQNLTVTSAAINYLGVKNLRDCARHAWDLPLWTQVAAATGAHFDDYMGRGSPAQDTADLGYVSALANKGILNFVEGGDDVGAKAAHFARELPRSRGRFAQPEWDRRWLSMSIFDANFALFDAQNSPRSVPELKNISLQTLDCKIFVYGPDNKFGRFLNDY